MANTFYNYFAFIHPMSDAEIVSLKEKLTQFYDKPEIAAIQILGTGQKIEQVLESDLEQSEFFTIYYESDKQSKH